jgi:hypothetical protein
MPSGHPLAAALALLLACTAAASACTSGRSSPGNAHYRYPHEVSYGRPVTCPNVPLAPLRDGGVSPDAARCSFADAQGSRVVHVGGKVVTAGESASDPGTGAGELDVDIHRLAGVTLNLDDPGPAVAHARTDAQGRFSAGGTFVPGNYAALARDRKDGRVLAWRMFVVPEGLTGRLDGVLVTIPLDPRLEP